MKSSLDKKLFYRIYICGGYSLFSAIKDCYQLDLKNVTAGWTEIAPLIKGRYKHQMVAANGLIYVIGGEGTLFEHDDIEASHTCYF